MKIADVHKIELKTGFPSLQEISAALDASEQRHVIDAINWEEYNYKPDIAFSIAYSVNEIYLKYFIRENYLKAEKTESNQMVCEDSCVEFFISPEVDGIYYNIEFNAIGTCLLGAGKDRETRTLATPSVISKIRRFTTAGTVPFAEKKGDFEWAMTIALPMNVFFLHKIKNIEGKLLRANFYKCGDKLTVPHYVTWNPVGTKNPDYHQPEHFGLLKFV